jgi:hypothetical protein
MQFRKAAGEYITFEERLGYLNAIAAISDRLTSTKIEEMTAPETIRWFNVNLLTGVRMSPAIWKAVSEKIAALHEAELLEKMKTIAGAKIEGWIRARKKEGYFFSDLVYIKALEVRLNYLDKKNKPNRVKQPVEFNLPAPQLKLLRPFEMPAKEDELRKN